MENAFYEKPMFFCTKISLDFCYIFPKMFLKAPCIIISKVLIILGYVHEEEQFLLSMDVI